jgi:colanic acid/amylovoran biosynthesis glycosyltransferase
MAHSIVIYRDRLLPYSETFIASQVEQYQRFQGLYVGTSHCGAFSVPLPIERCLVLGDYTRHAALWKAALKCSGMIYQPWLNAIAQHQPVLVHAHFGPDGLWGQRLAQRLRVPFVVTFHGNDATGLAQTSHPLQPADLITNRGRYFNALYQRQCPKLLTTANQIIAVSQFIGDRLSQLGCPPEKLVVHPIGVDLQRFTPQFTPHLGQGREPIVLFVGRLVEKKGCEYLIQAMTRVQTVLPDAQLVMIGDGPRRSRLERMARQQLNHVQFLGAQPHAVVKDWMNRATVLAVPSVTATNGDSEGLPTVIPEAMAMQLPVVATRHAGIPEAIIHGETGLLCAERDVETLAQHLAELLQTAELRQRLAIAARCRAARYFDLSTNTAKLETLYETLLITR